MKRQQWTDYFSSPPCLPIMKPRRKGLGFHIINLWVYLILTLDFHNKWKYETNDTNKKVRSEKQSSTDTSGSYGERSGQRQQQLGIGGEEGSGLWHWRRLGFGFGASVWGLRLRVWERQVENWDGVPWPRTGAFNLNSETKSKVKSDESQESEESHLR